MSLSSPARWISALLRRAVAPAGKPIFTEGIRDDNRDGIAAALGDHDGPIE